MSEENLVINQRPTIAVVGAGQIGKSLLVAIYEKRPDMDVMVIDSCPIVGPNLLNSSFEYSNQIEDAVANDIIVFCLPTSNDQEIKFLVDTVKDLDYQSNTLIIIQSTLPVGTSKDIQEYFAQKGSLGILGEDIFYAYAPERFDSLKYPKITDITKIVSADNLPSLLRAESFYASLGCTVERVELTKLGEICKLYENFTRYANIEIANIFARLCIENGVAPFSMITAAITKPEVPYVIPGFIGGKCLPYNAEMVSHAVNHPIVDLIVKEKSKRMQDIISILVAKKYKRILLIGKGFKQGSTNENLSPAWELSKVLLENNIEVELFDASMDLMLNNTDVIFDAVVIFHIGKVYFDVINKRLKRSGTIIDFTGGFIRLRKEKKYTYIFP